MYRSYSSHRNWHRAKSIDELSMMCRQRIPTFAWEYLQAGAEDENTLSNNSKAFRRKKWSPRTLIDCSEIDTKKKLLNIPCSMPLAIAPTGYNSMLWKNADISLAKAAKLHGIPFTLSTVSCDSIEDIATAVPDGNHWFQLYVFNDEKINDDLLLRARSSGFNTLVITTDAVTLGRREWDARSFTKPGRLSWKHTLDTALHPRWIMQALLPRGLPQLGNLMKYLPEGQRDAMGAVNFTSQKFEKKLSWEHIKKIRNKWTGNLIIKGIMNAEDALFACKIGADGIVVTNHGGRQLDDAPATLDILPFIANAVSGKISIFMDSGIRRGSDIAKSVALGADGVLSGRSTLYGVALGGQAGASHALNLLQEQLENTMAQIGRPNLEAINSGCLLKDELFNSVKFI